jgi:hypothetical protein
MIPFVPYTVSTWILLAVVLAPGVLFLVWASRRYQRDRINAREGPDAAGDLDRRTGGYRPQGGAGQAQPSSIKVRIRTDQRLRPNLGLHGRADRT